MTSWKYAWTSPYLANASPKALIMLVKRSWSGYDLFDILSSGFDILSFSFDILLWVLISYHPVLISYYGFWYPIISFDILSSGFDILSSVLISSHIGLISFHPIVWYPFISPVCQSRPPTKPPFHLWKNHARPALFHRCEQGRLGTLVSSDNCCVS